LTKGQRCSVKAVIVATFFYYFIDSVDISFHAASMRLERKRNRKCFSKRWFFCVGQRSARSTTNSAAASAL